MKNAFLQLHIAVFLAGFTAILGRLISMNEGLIVWYRLLLTMVTMWILYALRNKIQRIPFSEVLKICGVGVLATIHWITFYGAIKYSNVSVTLVCFSSISFFTALLEPVVLKKKLNWTELALGLITITGIYVIFHFDTQYKTGILIGIISALFAALFPIYTRQILQRVNVESMLVWQQTGGWIFLSALMPFYLNWFPSESLLPSQWDLVWLLVLSWLCSVLAHQLSANALKRLSAFTVNLSYSLEPVYGIVLAFVIFKENQLLSNWFYVGFAIIATALIIHVIVLMKNERKLMSDANIRVS
jgi:drug/metabolite transporter (DMT)-like permease